MNSFKPYSNNPEINRVIENMLSELCPFLEEQANRIQAFTAIGQALGNHESLSGLFDMILSLARRFANADGGSLYLVDALKQELVFHVIHNDSLKITHKEFSSEHTDLPNVKLYKKNGKRNLSNVSSYVFHTGEIVNIEDVYETNLFQFSGTREFDRELNYRSKSMLVIPMRNHEDTLIGVLQLINAMDSATCSIIPFNEDTIQKSRALAAQAAVMITQQSLIHEMEELFEAFIRAIAVTIDEKSKHTGGHIQRVTDISLMIADCINRDNTLFHGTILSHEEIKELRMAALMHDTGKITTPDHVIDKSSKLETIFDRISMIEARLEIFSLQKKLAAAERKLALSDNSRFKDISTGKDTTGNEPAEEIKDVFEMIKSLNENKTFITPDQIRQLESIKAKTIEIRGHSQPVLTEDEFLNLCIPKGNLTEAERDIINHHAKLTAKILNKLPWPKKFSRIPYIAGAHHEKLDGSGYPDGLDQDQLNLQARILAVADIFEALSARDRPYKKPMPLSKTIDILKEMAQNGLIDRNIVDVFFRSEFPVEYAKKHLLPSQLNSRKN